MRLYSRSILREIKPFIKRKEAIIIKGMRQAGKTSTLKLLEKILIFDHKINKKFIYFFDLENMDIREDLNNDPKNLLKYIDGGKKKKYIFLDEVQYLDNPANFIKIITDHFPYLKLFATGSSSLDIKRKIQDSLVGRAVYFHLYPLNFREFLDFKNKIFPLEPTENQYKKLNDLLSKYLKYGGFPAVVLETNLKVKEKLLKNYVNLYISKDIRNLAEIENISAFNNLTKVLAGQIGGLFNNNETANTLSISYKTLIRYLDILLYTFAVIKIRPFFINIRSSLTKTTKIYFYDLGIRNSILNNFSEIEYRIDNGAMFENFILLELLSKFGREDICFYRNSKQAEIDFIAGDKSTVEVKYKKYKNKKVFRVFDNFGEFNNKIVNLNFNEKLRNYEFIDWWRFINLR